MARLLQSTGYRVQSTVGKKKLGESITEYKCPLKSICACTITTTTVYNLSISQATSFTTPQPLYQSNKMQLSAVLTFAVALLAGQSLAAPELEKRTTCQACDIAGYDSGPACCSAHV